MNEGEGPYLYSAIPALEFELSAPAALLREKVSEEHENTWEVGLWGRAWFHDADACGTDLVGN